MKKFSLSFAKGSVNCDVCFQHENKKIAKLKYYTQDYASNKRKGKICKTPQKHHHEIWICDRCLQDLRGEWWSKTNERFECWDKEVRGKE